MGIHNPDASSSVAYLTMMAIAAASQSMSSQQEADAKTTINLGKFEDAINEFWYGSNAYADNSGIDGKPNPSGVNNIQECLEEMQYYSGNPQGGDFIEWQTAYSRASATAQTVTGRADSLMQMSNSQTNTDATNIQQVMQLSTMMNFMGYVTNLLAKG